MAADTLTSDSVSVRYQRRIETTWGEESNVEPSHILRIGQAFMQTREWAQDGHLEEQDEFVASGRLVWSLIHNTLNMLSVGLPIYVEPHLGIDRLRVPYDIDDRIWQLFDTVTLQAASIVTAIVSRRIAEGLPVKHVYVKALVDYDAAQWKELVFTIDVDLGSEDANREWDQMIAEISDRARQTDAALCEALLEEIGVHFRWILGSHV